MMPLTYHEDSGFSVLCLQKGHKTNSDDSLPHAGVKYNVRQNWKHPITLINTARVKKRLLVDLMHTKILSLNPAQI